MQTSTQLDCATSSRICLQSHQPRMSCIKRLEAIKTPNTHRQREKKRKKTSILSGLTKLHSKPYTTPLKTNTPILICSTLKSTAFIIEY